MMGSLTTNRLRWSAAAAALLALLGSAPARAVTSTVYWDRADYGFGPGFGLSAATATSSGLPIHFLDPAVTSDRLRANPLPTTDTLSQSLQKGPPALVSQSWSSTNNVLDLNNGTGADENQTLYLIYTRPIESELVLDQVTHDIVYDPKDVGLVLSNGEGGPDWVIFQTIAGAGNTVYLPAVSLGMLANGATRDYSIHYSLKNPQLFKGDSLDKLGVPAWEIAFITRPIPEPASGLLMLFGLLGIARARRKRA